MLFDAYLQTATWLALHINQALASPCQQGLSGYKAQCLQRAYICAAETSVLPDSAARLCLLVQVRLVDFSPNEKYIITYSSQDPSNPREKATVVFNVFDIRTGRKLRNFTGSVDEFAVGAAAGTAGMLMWPVYKWAGGPHDK